MLQQQFTLILISVIMSKLLLFDFSATDDWSAWEIENDVVMGGNSTSKLERSADGNAIFKGSISLENDGGFASIQYHFAPKNIRGYSKVLIRLKGDGKDYQFRTKADLKEKASYIYTFKTSGEWETIEVPLNEMKPMFRGEEMDLPNFSADEIQEARFLIGNKKAEDFILEIEKIELR